jgi:hypothetical protein
LFFGSAFADILTKHKKPTSFFIKKIIYIYLSNFYPMIPDEYPTDTHRVSQKKKEKEKKKKKH